MDAVGRVIAVALALFTLTRGTFSIDELVGLLLLVITSMTIWELRRRRLGWRICALEETVARSVARREGEDAMEDHYIASRRYSELDRVPQLALRYEAPIWLILNLGLAALIAAHGGVVNR